LLAITRWLWFVSASCSRSAERANFLHAGPAHVDGNFEARFGALGDLPAGRRDRLGEGGWRAVGRQRRREDDQVVEVQAAA
jgi:hypothetical protein